MKDSIKKNFSSRISVAMEMMILKLFMELKMNIQES